MFRAIPTLLLLAALATAQISYPDFSNLSGLTLNGVAAQNGSAIRLNPATASQVGGFWANTPLSVAGGFETYFSFRVTGLVSGGADGFAFVIHNDPRGVLALGNHAGALGYGAFVNSPAGTAIANSVAIEFDTYQGSPLGVPETSPNNISIHTNGSADNSHSEAHSIGEATPVINMSDGQVHTARILYQPGTLAIYLDDFQTPVLSVPYDFATGGTHILSSTPVGGLNLVNGEAIVGFTGSTGGVYENHDILSWSTAPWEYQTNGPAASLSVNGAADPGPLQAIETLALVGDTNTIELASTNAGLPWELGILAGGAPVPLSQGGLNTAGGQTWNLPFTPATSFLFGGALPGFGLSAFPASTLSLPVSFLNAIELSAQMIVIDPASADGLALSHALHYEVVSCPSTENFDGLASGINYPLGWSNGGGGAEWRVASGTTSSAGTGPLTGAFSGANYFYCETSAPNSGGVSFLFDTCNYDSTALTSLQLSFRLSRLGATIGTLNIYQDDGAGFLPTPIASYSGAEPSGLDWTSEIIPLVPGGPTIAFRFEYVSGSSFTGDLAIDDFSVF